LQIRRITLPRVSQDRHYIQNYLHRASRLNSESAYRQSVGIVNQFRSLCRPTMKKAFDQKFKFAKSSSNSSPSVLVRTLPSSCCILFSTSRRLVAYALPAMGCRFIRCTSSFTSTDFCASSAFLNGGTSLLLPGPSCDPEDTSECASFSDQMLQHRENKCGRTCGNNGIDGNGRNGRRRS